MPLSELDFIKAACGHGDYLLLRAQLSGEQLEGSAFQELARRLCSRRRGVGADGVLAFTRKQSHPCTVYAASPRFPNDTISGDALFCAARFLFDQGEYGIKPFPLQFQGRLFTVESVDSQNFRIEIPPPSNAGQEPDWNRPLLRTRIQETDLVPWEGACRLGTVYAPASDTAVLRKTARALAQAPRAQAQGVAHQPLVAFSTPQKDLVTAWVYATSWFDQSFAAAAVALHSHLEGLSSSEVLVSLNNQPFYLQVELPGPRVWVTAPVQYIFQGLYSAETSFF